MRFALVFAAMALTDQKISEEGAGVILFVLVVMFLFDMIELFK